MFVIGFVIWATAILIYLATACGLLIVLLRRPDRKRTKSSWWIPVLTMALVVMTAVPVLMFLL